MSPGPIPADGTWWTLEARVIEAEQAKTGGADVTRLEAEIAALKAENAALKTELHDTTAAG